jgi:hypothetical protein
MLLRAVQTELPSREEGFALVPDLHAVGIDQIPQQTRPTGHAIRKGLLGIDP